MTTKKEIASDGYRRGKAIVNNMDVIYIGSICHEYGEYRNELVTTDNWRDINASIAYECESYDRSFSSFEDTAYELNELIDKKPYNVWEVYDDGISRGINAGINERFKAQIVSKKEYWQSFTSSDKKLFNRCWKQVLKCVELDDSLDINSLIKIENLLEKYMVELAK